MSSFETPPRDDPAEFRRRVDEAFQEALELAGAERDPFLERLARDEPDVHRELVRLLGLEADAARFMDESQRAISEAVVDELGRFQWSEADEIQGLMVGRYRLLEEIGRGGAGTVYLAERADGSFEQQVAVKVLRRGLDTDDTVRRFLAERRILASLHHDSIAAVYDGGATDDGRPYFVMEYVQGRPITEYADAHELSVEERIRLVLEVGRAVQHAHHRLVIHRDLKPSNILVTDQGVVKLLDFGIAKLLDPSQHPESSVRTRTGILLFTPEYASPEQVSGEEVTTATDVYQLGAVLYVLLTAHRPYRVGDSSPLALREAILQQLPRRPSEAVASPDRGQMAGVGPAGEPGTPPSSLARELARLRGTDPRSLSRGLTGDLDTIVLKALRKEPERRYRSVDRLVEDLERYLNGHPVSARPDTFWYRSRKLLGRRPWILPSAAAALVVGLLLGGGLVVHSERMQEERDRAMVEARKAEEVTDLLIGMFESANPETERRDTLTVRTLLESGAETLQEQLAGEPEVRASLMHALGRVHRNLGLYEESRALLEEARAIRFEVGGEDHPEMTHTLLDVARVHFDEHRFEEAEALYTRALERERRRTPPDTILLARTLEQLGATLRETGAPDSAADLVRQALALREEHQGRDHPNFVQAQSTLAYILRGKGDLDEAEALYREVLARQEADSTMTPRRAAATRNNLAYLLRERGELEEAEALYRAALETNRAILGEGHRITEMTMSNLATAVYFQGRVDEAGELLRERAEMARSALPEDHWRVAGALASVALFLVQEERYEEAEEYRRESVEIYRVALGPGHERTLRAQGRLGAILVAQGRFEEAEAELLEAYRLLEVEAGEGGEGIQDVSEELLRHMVVLYEEWGQPDAAEPYLAQLR